MHVSTLSAIPAFVFLSTKTGQKHLTPTLPTKKLAIESRRNLSNLAGFSIFAVHRPNFYYLNHGTHI